MACPYGPPVYVYVQPKPGGGTAITGGILALLQGLLLGFLAVAFAMSADDIGSMVAVGTFVSVVGTISGFYLVESIMLFCRRAAGRVLVIAAATLAIVGITSLALGALFVSGMEKSDVAPASIFVSIVFAIELLTLCLAAAGSTGRWIAARRTAGQPPAPPYPYY
ncbi:hypothetical protein [Nocardia wallacei]|uniref:Uncharacterized protein n=1 Tax=Nocardia wallacei TaxID=480035 RepID=A0A7G1KDI7_9NOCA|nr:hypothetical protein [Nocardia wallacei]BCK52343.1 hypothetical protein NWFMUON74_01150 [Nocardia wallacei]